MKNKISALLAGKAHETGDISVKELVFSPELYAACEKNLCGHYNSSWTCPPAVGTLEEQREKILAYSRAFVFTTMYQMEDSFDYEGMTVARERHSALTEEMREALGEGVPIYGAGSCPICRPKDRDGTFSAGDHGKYCAFPDPCRFPDRIISSIEAAGINVTELSKSAGVKYNNGTSTVTYFSMILY